MNQVIASKINLNCALLYIIKSLGLLKYIFLFYLFSKDLYLLLDFILL